jgi:hypothetical protein
LGIFRQQKDGLTALPTTVLSEDILNGLVDLMEKTETRSENARQVILSYNGKIFYVSMVRVNFCKGSEKHRAIFHAREAKGCPAEDLAMEIPQNLYETLLKYTSLNNPDLILVLQVEGTDFKWGFTSDSWLRQHLCRDSFREYVV